MNYSNNVVVTGIGIVNSLGATMAENWEKLISGESGIVSVNEKLPHLAGFGVHVVAPAVPFSLNSFNLSRKFCRSMDFVSKMLVYSGLNALKDGGFAIGEETKNANIGAIVGTGNSICDEFREMPFNERNPKWFLSSYPNIHLGNLSIAGSLTGFGMTIVNACTSGSQAIGTAFQMIANGKADVMIAGGSESKLSPSYLSGFSRLNMHTKSKCSNSAMRPFDKDRNGFVLGEGAAMLLLERQEHAEKRGVKPLAKIVGYGSSMDAFRITDASAEGKSLAMKQALKDANIEPKEIDYINSHGTSTQSNDREEALAIKKVFGSYSNKIPVNSTKSMVGHTMAASGAIEAAVCVTSMNESLIHPTNNFVCSGKEFDLSVVHKKTLRKEINYCMSNSSGIGGCNTSLIFERM